MKTKNISKGVNLYIISDDRFKTNTASLVINRPLCREDASYNALLPFVLRRGSKLYPDFSLIEEKLSDLCGARVSSFASKRGERQAVSFECSSLANNFAPDGEDLFGNTIRLMLEIVFNPLLENGAFKKEYVESEKKNLIEAIEAMPNDKMQYAIWRLNEEMCKGEAYGVCEYGTKESVGAITAESLYDYYNKIINESRIDVFICGRFDEDIIFSMLGEYIPQNLKRSEVYPVTVPKKKDSEVKKIVDEFDTSQAKLSLGFTTGFDAKDRDFVHLMLANSILGSGVHSKLFNNVREKLSLAYYAFSRLERSKQMMIIGMGIEQENYEAAFNETMQQIDALKRGEISDYEFESAKAFLINNAISASDSQLSMIRYEQANLVCGITDTIADLCRKIEQTTMQQVVDAVQNISLDTIYFLKGR